MRFALPLLFMLVPAAELVVVLAVESRIGWPASIAVIVVTGLIGAGLVRRQGKAAYNAIRSVFQSGLFPGQEMAHGALILIGGAFLLTPGFITDTVGFLLMVPTVREMVRLRAVGFARRRALR